MADKNEAKLVRYHTSPYNAIEIARQQEWIRTHGTMYGFTRDPSERPRVIKEGRPSIFRHS